MWKNILIALVLLYVISPYDLLPDFIIGPGWLDDLILVGVLWYFLYALKKKRTAFQQFHRQNDQFHRRNQGDKYYEKDQFHSDSFESSTLKDPYRILGLEKTATDAEIKQAYRHLASKYHPDKVEHLGEEFRILAEKRFKEIQEAYQKLKN